MLKFNTLDDVIALAEFAHRNQIDKAGMPYIEHPRRVMQAVQAQGAMPYVQMAAILHDVTEDTAFTPEMLLELGVPEAAVDIVKLVDRDQSYQSFLDILEGQRLLLKSWEGLDNFELETAIKEWSENNRPWIGSNMTADEFYYSEIKRNAGALQVKLADIGDNLQPWRLNYLSEDKQNHLRNKYAKALKLLKC